MNGIDVSEANGNIDFNKVKKNGIDFVIIRVGWIGNKENHTLDKYFNQNYVNAKNVGLKIGFYVYNYSKSTEAIKSGANWVLNNIKGKTFDYPVFIDMEDSSLLVCKNLNLLCMEFCNIINSNGFKAGIYANLDWFRNKLNINELLNYKIWLAEWNGKENHTANFKVDMWQYSSKGKIDGIVGNVDLNKCLNCAANEEEITGNNENKGGFEVKIYQNGSTRETVFQDVNCKTPIGYLNPRETAECYGIIDNKAIVVYKIDGTNNKKVGFCRWLGGVK